MTTHMDEDSRRRQVGEALLDVVREQGMDGTTLRQVAATAGVSVGLVQRYFRTKAELFSFGIEYVYERSEARLGEVPWDDPGMSAREVIERLAEVSLPLDENRDREVRVELAFIQLSLNNPELAKVHDRYAAEVIEQLRAILESARASGELAADTDIPTTAAEMVAVLSGLQLNGVANTHQGTEVMRAVISQYLDRLFPAHSGDER
ncbi:TetR/AcrR family transcriptional regulator [Nocardiopsis sp. HNM0947]|uniref:TetR/AcrR family transcriptional regulator n=1 Tax=Nocardiopsis coralli TaxID=2772213 RepID=A0ABR9P8H2_9ACTN|nr:TetR/AcrR family transcriptional regulator [Nocardiopsis coralli]MBE3000141.1 TetR/AcrR family transcriptional regulator [Nocardiopsis coralli]